MKKRLFASALIVTGFFTIGFSSYFVKAEVQNLDPIGDKIGWEDGRSDVEDPVVANDGLEDGVDNSMVQPKITKVSDDIDLVPSEFGKRNERLERTAEKLKRLNNVLHDIELFRYELSKVP